MGGAPRASNKRGEGSEAWALVEPGRGRPEGHQVGRVMFMFFPILTKSPLIRAQDGKDLKVAKLRKGLVQNKFIQKNLKIGINGMSLKLLVEDQGSGIRDPGWKN